MAYSSTSDPPAGGSADNIAESATRTFLSPAQKTGLTGGSVTTLHKHTTAGVDPSTDRQYATEFEKTWLSHAQNAFVFADALGDGVTDYTEQIQAALDAVEATGKPGFVMLHGGIFPVSSLSLGPLVGLRGSGINVTRVKMKNGANAAAVIQTKDFATLDAAGNYSVESGGVGGGSFRNRISDLTVDGNKGNNTAGRGIQLYGRAFHLEDLSIENCYETGLYTAFNGPDNFSTPAGTLEAKFFNLSIQQCGGNGWTYRGPHDSQIRDVESFANGGWGWQIERSSFANSVNTYLNTSGGIRACGTSGCIVGANICGSSATGYGGLFETGGSDISSSVWGGCAVGLEVRGYNHIRGTIGGTSVAALRLNGTGAGGKFDLSYLANNAGVWVDNGPTIPTVQSDIRISSGSALGTLFNSGSAPTPYGSTLVIAPNKGGTYVRGHEPASSITRRTVVLKDWIPTALSQPTLIWGGLAASPNSETVYAVNSGGTCDVYKRTNGTGSFVAMTSGIPGSLQGVAVGPDDSVYVIADGQKVYKQTAGAGAFEVMADTAALAYRGVCVAPNGDVFLAVDNGDIYRIPSGSSTPVALSQTSRAWRSLAAKADGKIRATVNSGDVYESAGGTADFVALSLTTGLALRRSAFAPNGDYYVCTGTDLYLQPNGAGALRALGLTSPGNFLSVTVSPAGVVYTGASTGDIYSHAGRVGLVVTPGYDKVSEYVFPIASLPGNSTLIVVPDASMMTKQTVRIRRHDRNGYTLAIVNGGAGAGTLFTSPVSPTADAAISLSYDGTNFALASTDWLSSA